jgi:hypothetical protein
MGKSITKEREEEKEEDYNNSIHSIINTDEAF